MNAPQLRSLKSCLEEMRRVQGIKYVLISKNWWKEANIKRESVHVDDVDLVQYLADMEENCLYKIELYKRYY